MGPKRVFMQPDGTMGPGRGGRGRGGRGRGRGQMHGQGRGRGRGGGGGGGGRGGAMAAIEAGHGEDGPNDGPGMKWPPVVKNLKVYGEITDVNGRNIPRDQGRSIQLGEHVYYVFGDTFCHDDRRQFVGVTDNTVGFVPDQSRPWKSQYLSRQPRVPQYIPYTESERAYTEAPENKAKNSRIVIWSFGGVIEDWPGSGQGWIFFDKLITNGADPGHFFGMSVARVSLHEGHHIRVDRIIGDRMIFGPDEPKFGSISCLPDDDGYVYLLGHKDQHKPAIDFRNHWARIKRLADFTQRSNYEFLLNDGRWSSTYTLSTLKVVLAVMGQGGILKLPGFAPRAKGPYMWFGVNKFMGNRLYIGTSRRLDGPWDIVDVMEIPKILGDKSAFRYCLYPHTWAADLGRGQMFISWSDNGDFGGRVGCAMFRFEMVGEPPGVDQEIEQEEAELRQQQYDSLQQPQQPLIASTSSAGVTGGTGGLMDKLLGRFRK